MKKFLFLTFGLFWAGSFALAQTLVVKGGPDQLVLGSDNPTAVVINEGDTVVVKGDRERKFYWTVKNVSDQEVIFGAELTPVEPMPEGAYWACCAFGQCVIDLWKISNSENTNTAIPAGDSIGYADVESFMPGFDFAYTPVAGDKDPFLVKMAFYTEAGNDTLTFYVNFENLEETANEAPVAQAAISAYPNPAVDQVNFRLENVKAGSVVVLRDLSGKTVRRMSVDGAAEMNMNLNGLASGMYFYSVEENGSTVAVGKLMVR